MGPYLETAGKTPAVSFNEAAYQARTDRRG
jgi:hypothetical protein